MARYIKFHNIGPNHYMLKLRLFSVCWTGRLNGANVNFLFLIEICTLKCGIWLWLSEE